MDDSSTPQVKLPPPQVQARLDPVAHNESLQIARLFLTTMKARRPYATWGIAVLIGMVFALQLYVGHMDSNAAFIRMGALYPPRVFEQGEFWRLASCTLLHADWMHVGFNVYVLVILGIFVERILGTPRFLVLYVCSAFAGSVGSLFFLGEGFSVGASGAVWGLLGAHAVLAFRPTDLLPELMLPGVKKAAMINLGLNVLYSFRPGVDMWAHFAGGASGALVFLLLSRSVPRVPKTLPSSPGDIFPAKVPAPKFMWPLGLGALLGLLSLTGVAVAVGKPLELDVAPAFTRVDHEWLGLSVELPTDLLERSEQEVDGAARELIVGAAVEDTMMVAVFVAPHPALSAAEADAEVASLETLEAPAGGRHVQEPQRVSVGDFPAMLVRDELENGILLDRVFVVYPERLVRVTVFRWPGFEQASPQGAAMRITESLLLL